MDFKDLAITPIYFFLFTLVAYLIAPYVTSKESKKYFIPALWFKFGGAIALGVIYQFYYTGGDTFNYFLYGSKWIWEALLNEPLVGINLLLEEGGGERAVDTFRYSQHIWYYKSPQSYMIVKIASLFDLFTFHTYSATALFFALFSFSGLWALFETLHRHENIAVRPLAIAVLFLPSVMFWGSGILKDTITLGAASWLAFVGYRVIEFRRINVVLISIALVASYLLINIKIYIFLCIVPTLFLWFYVKQIQLIRNRVLQILVVPVLLILITGAAYSLLQVISADSHRYSLDAIAETAAITSYDIRYGWGARTGGDGGYDLGYLDGSWQSMIQLFPEAIVVSLFRPFLWEVKNPLMLLSALEGIMTFFLFIKFLRTGAWKRVRNNPFLIFCLVFSLLFAFAVGVSTYNFGTLMRYKIPMMPFLWILLVSAYPKRKKMVTQL